MASPLNRAAYAVDHPPGGVCLGGAGGDGVEGQEGQPRSGPLAALAAAAAAGASVPASAAGAGETSDESICEECGAAATWRCDSCAASLCDGCEADLHRAKVTRSHVRVPLADAKVGQGAAPAAASPAGASKPASSISPNCALHPDQPKSVYCSDCEVVVCTFCCDGHGKHNKHATQPDLALAVEQVLQRRSGLAASLQGKHGGAEQVAKDFAAAQEHQQKLAATTAQSLQLLQEVAEQLHAAVDARCKELADSIRAKDAAASATLQSFVQNTREASQACEHLQSFIVAASPPGASPLQILSQEELVSARFADASRKITQYAKTVSVQRGELEMDPAGILGGIQALGTLSKERTIIHFSWIALDSRILTDESNAALAGFFFKEPAFVDAKLLYSGSRDGWTYKDWAAKCAGQCNTLTLIKVAGSGNVMGGFLAPAWSSHFVGSWIADPSLRSFVFSLVNAHHRPVKFKLTNPGYAALHHPSHGVYLCYSSIALMQDNALNTEGANTQLDDEYERKQGRTAPVFSLGPGLMSGNPEGRFACEEIEVFAMKAS